MTFRWRLVVHDFSLMRISWSLSVDQFFGYFLDQNYSMIIHCLNNFLNWIIHPPSLTRGIRGVQGPINTREFIPPETRERCARGRCAELGAGLSATIRFPFQEISPRLLKPYKFPPRPNKFHSKWIPKSICILIQPDFSHGSPRLRPPFKRRPVSWSHNP